MYCQKKAIHGNLFNRITVFKSLFEPIPFYQAGFNRRQKGLKTFESFSLISKKNYKIFSSISRYLATSEIANEQNNNCMYLLHSM